MDKTGTLTYGRPAVQAIIPLNGHTVAELMEKAVALEKSSEHPLARAILRKGEEMGIEVEAASHYQSIKGKGALATYKGKLYWIGSHRFMHEMGQETKEIHDKALALEDEGHSIVAIGNDKHVCGLISIADSPRQWIRETIASIKSVGLQEVVMLTGDNEPTARALAAHAGVDRFYAELLPEEKVDQVRALVNTWDKVGMVGDEERCSSTCCSNNWFCYGRDGERCSHRNGRYHTHVRRSCQTPVADSTRKTCAPCHQTEYCFRLRCKSPIHCVSAFSLATLWMAIAADTGATMLVIFNGLRLLKTRK